jgi:drug/metabolite transporter (DMT)-like permease
MFSLWPLRPQSRRPFVPLVLCVGVCAISFAAIFFRQAAPTHPLISAGVRLLIAGTILLPVTIRAARSGVLTGPVVKAGILAGLLYAAHFGTWVWSLSLTTVAASVTLVTATPLFLAVIAVFTGRDRPDKKLWISLSLAVAGVAMIGGVDFGTSTTALIGDVLALCGAAAIALYMLVVRPFGEKLEIWSFAGIATLTGGCTLLSLAFVLGIPIEVSSTEAFFYLFLAALIPQLIGHSALTWCLRYTSPTIVGISTLGEPVGSTLLAWWLLDEIPAAGILVGCTITLSAVIFTLLRPGESEVKNFDEVTSE